MRQGSSAAVVIIFEQLSLAVLSTTVQQTLVGHTVVYTGLARYQGWFKFVTYLV